MFLMWLLWSSIYMSNSLHMCELMVSLMLLLNVNCQDQHICAGNNNFKSHMSCHQQQRSSYRRALLSQLYYLMLCLTRRCWVEWVFSTNITLSTLPLWTSSHHSERKLRREGKCLIWAKILSRKIIHSQSSACNWSIAAPPEQWVLSNVFHQKSFQPCLNMAHLPFFIYMYLQLLSFSASFDEINTKKSWQLPGSDFFIQTDVPELP